MHFFVMRCNVSKVMKIFNVTLYHINFKGLLKRFCQFSIRLIFVNSQFAQEFGQISCAVWLEMQMITMECFSGIVHGNHLFQEMSKIDVTQCDIPTKQLRCFMHLNNAS